MDLISNFFFLLTIIFDSDISEILESSKDIQLLVLLSLTKAV